MSAVPPAVVVLDFNGMGRYGDEAAVNGKEAEKKEAKGDGAEQETTAAEIEQDAAKVKQEPATTAVLNVTNSPGTEQDSHKNLPPSAPPADSRTEAPDSIPLLRQQVASISLADKVAQMAQVDVSKIIQRSEDTFKYILNNTAAEYYFGELGVGSLLNVPSYNALDNSTTYWTAADFRSVLQQINGITQSYNRTRVIWGMDSMHGANYIFNATILPHAINIAATFESENAYIAGKLASRDTRAAGIQWVYAPLLEIVMQPRWSRNFESFGEDPMLVGDFAAQMTAGIQETDTNTAFPQQAAACAKHFVGYSYPRNSNDRSPSWIPTRHLFQYFLKPWRKILQPELYMRPDMDAQRLADSRPMSVMQSFTEYDGVPIISYPYALEYMLRQRLDYHDGVLLSDWSEARHLAEWHRIVNNTDTAQIYAMQHGTIDVSMVPNEIDEWMDSITAAVENGEIMMERIDMSVQRLLDLKTKVGLMDNNNNELTMNDPNLALVGSDDESALQMARESIILAKNDNNALPLLPAEPLNVLVVGPTSDSLSMQSGAWTGQWQGPDNMAWFTRGQTVLGAVSTEQRWTVTSSCGVDIDGMDCSANNTTATNSIQTAASQIKGNNVVIACIGEPVATEKPGDISSLDLPQGQYDLVRTLRQAINTNNANATMVQTKLVLVYFGGRTRLLHDMVEHADAIVLGMLPGPTGGQAVTDVLTGRYNPSGRLPVTWPLYDGDGTPYWHAVSSKCRDEADKYANVECGVLYEYGHGLSYTTYVYSDLSVAMDDVVSADESMMRVSVRVSNMGSMAGWHVVLLFVYDEYREVTPSYRRMCGYKRVYVEADAAVDVEMQVSMREMSEYVGADDDSHYVYGDHPYMLGVGVETDCRDSPFSNNCLLVGSSIAQELTNPDITFTTIPQAVSTTSPACGEACKLWDRSGCADSFELDMEMCSTMCINSGSVSPSLLNIAHLGWGWNYVKCLESVVYGLERKRRDAMIADNDCLHMTSLCRNIFATPNMNAYGVSPVSIPIPITSIVILPGGGVAMIVSGLFVSLLLIFGVKAFKRNGRASDGLIV